MDIYSFFLPAQACQLLFAILLQSEHEQMVMMEEENYKDSSSANIIQPLYISTCKAVIFSVVCLSSAGLKDIWILSAAALGCSTAFFLRLRFPTVYGAIDGYYSEEWEAVQLLSLMTRSYLDSRLPYSLFHSFTSGDGRVAQTSFLVYAPYGT
jgi:hypothetical protein